jgi:hypothetical protein
MFDALEFWRCIYQMNLFFSLAYLEEGEKVSLMLLNPKDVDSCTKSYLQVCRSMCTHTHVYALVLDT